MVATMSSDRAQNHGFTTDLILSGLRSCMGLERQIVRRAEGREGSPKMLRRLTNDLRGIIGESKGQSDGVLIMMDTQHYGKRTSG